MNIEYAKRSVKAINGMDKPIKKQLVDVIDCLPEQEQILLFEIAKRFIADDVANADDVEAVRAARQEYANGETVNHDAINWDY